MIACYSKQKICKNCCAYLEFAREGEKAGHRPLSTIKLMKSDPEAMEVQREDVKARYRSIFGA
jgi:hypothetical protein